MSRFISFIKIELLLNIFEIWGKLPFLFLKKLGISKILLYILNFFLLSSSKFNSIFRFGKTRHKLMNYLDFMIFISKFFGI